MKFPKYHAAAVKTATYGGRMAGESLDALSDMAAIEWCEARCIDPDIIAAHFSIDEA